MRNMMVKDFQNTNNDIFVLDACRYDLFEDINWLNGELERVWSLEAYTKSVCDKLRCGVEKTIYTAHPLVHQAYPKTVDVYTDENQEYFWHPKWLKYKYDELKNQADYEPSIYWFLQPHRPFLYKDDGNIVPYRNWEDRDEIFPPKKAQMGHDLVKQRFEENLKIILEYIEYNFEPPIILTSDHGDMWGEHGKWDHKNGWDYKEVREVPWFLWKN